MQAICFNDVWEMYRIKFIVDGKSHWEDFWALEGASFDIAKGEAVGIIGENGAGKSTILKLIMGLLEPNRGQVRVVGRVAGLLELGAGFKPELTGRENVYLSSGLFGLKQGEIEERYGKIAEFAGIGRFINAPVKCYSQGMFVRLAFAIAIHIDPDILVIDDTLAVGDEDFQRKCIKKIMELKEQGKTIVMVSHDINVLSHLAKRVIFLKQGRVVKDDSIEQVAPLYTQTIGSGQGVGVLAAGPLDLVFNNGRLFLNWRNHPLTSSFGAHSCLYVNGTRYSSNLAHWQVEKENEKKLSASGRWLGLPFSQVWELELKQNNSLSCRVSLNLESGARLEQQYVSFLFSPEYKQWFTGHYGQGEFPPQFLKDDMVMLQRCIASDIIGLRSPDKNLPDLSLRFSDELGNFGLIFNSGFYNNARILRVDKVEPETNREFSPGNYPCFSIELNLDEDKKAATSGAEKSIAKDRLRFVFERGRGRIFWEGLELTRELGLYTSLRSAGRWHDSASWAIWKAESSGGDIIEAVGEWSYLPLIQSWRIQLINDKLIEFAVAMKVGKEMEVDRTQTNLMLSEKYKNWIAGKEKGEFPDFKHDINDDWHRLWSGDAGRGKIGVSANNSPGGALPEVLFSCREASAEQYLNIVNSDIYHRGRVLQLLDQTKKILPPGEYRYFNGEIRIE